MRRYWVLPVLAIAILAGCGGDDEDSGKEADQLANRVAAWRFAAVSYNQLLQTCQVSPEGIIIPACTRNWRVATDRETARLVAALRAHQSTSAECTQAIARTQEIVGELNRTLTRTYRFYVAAERAREEDREYRGPAIFPLLTRAKKVTARDRVAADRLASTIRESC